MITRVARPYAKALLETVPDLTQAQAVRRELGQFAALMAEVPRIEAMAASPGVPLEVKVESVGEIAERLELSAPARRLLVLLVENFRLGHLPAILEAVDETLDRRLGVVVARVTSAHPLEQDQQARLASVLAAGWQGEVRLVTEVDPTLLGGFVVQVRSVRYDGSLAGQLRRLSSQLATAA